MRRYKIDMKEFSEINITPFTDVVLVLLVIFIIASPSLITGALKVTLPGSATGDQTNITTKVYLTEANVVMINGQSIPLNYSLPTLKEELSKLGSTEVVIYADKNSKHGNVVQLFDILKSAGVKKIVIGTQRPQAESVPSK